MPMQQGDVKLFHTLDDGEISVLNGIVSMSGGLETAVYLSWFGGNEEDSGLSDTVKSWWGNIDETDPDYVYRSRLQFLLKSIPSTVNNLRRIEDAAIKDIQWMINKKVVTEIAVSASIPAANRVKIVATLNGDKTIEFIENWKVEL